MCERHLARLYFDRIRPTNHNRQSRLTNSRSFPSSCINFSFFHFSVWMSSKPLLTASRLAHLEDLERQHLLSASQSSSVPSYASTSQMPRSEHGTLSPVLPQAQHDLVQALSHALASQAAAGLPTTLAGPVVPTGLAAPGVQFAQGDRVVQVYEDGEEPPLTTAEFSLVLLALLACLAVVAMSLVGVLSLEQVNSFGGRLAKSLLVMLILFGTLFAKSALQRVLPFL